jgi:hypothetical protein
VWIVGRPGMQQSQRQSKHAQPQAAQSTIEEV